MSKPEESWYAKLKRERYEQGEEDTPELTEEEREYIESCEAPMTEDEHECCKAMAALSLDDFVQAMREVMPDFAVDDPLEAHLMHFATRFRAEQRPGVPFDKAMQKKLAKAFKRSRH